jgi:hypothetical protein
MRGASKRISRTVSSRLPRGEAARRVFRSLMPRSSSTAATGRDIGHFIARARRVFVLMPLLPFVLFLHLAHRIQSSTRRQPS